MVLSKSCALGILFAMSLCAANGQQKSIDVKDYTAEVNEALIELKAGLFTSIAAKRLGRLGDEAANATIRSHTLEEMKKEPMAMAIVRMIALSLNPNLTINEVDKTPKMSILLLSYLKSSVKTPEVLKEIDLALQAANRESDAQAYARTK